MKSIRFLSFLVMLGAFIWSFADIKVSNLTTEHLVNPLNIEAENPRLGWMLTSDEKNVMQTSYHILVASSPEKLEAGLGDLWNSGIVQSDESIWIKYDGKKLKPNEKCYWKVRVETTNGKSRWSQPAMWGMGLMIAQKWKGRWIGWEGAFEWDEETSHSRMSARYLRHEFNTHAKDIKRATVHISGLGLYELFLNGQKVGDDVLSPAPTDYRRTVLYNSYDGTGMLKGQESTNAIGVTLGNGRYYTMQQNYKPYKIPTFGYPQVLLNLIVEYTDGSVQHVSTNEKEWKLTARGPIRSNNEYDGEIYDARLELGDWTLPGYDDADWLNAQRARLPYGTLRGNTSANMKVMAELAPQSIRDLQGRCLVDFGQNTAGWVRLKINGTALGDTVTIRYSEHLTADSLALDVKNLRHAQSTDRYIANGKEKDKWWSPRFSYHGFRYAEISGLKNLQPEDIACQVIYDAMDSNGDFECSSQVMNAIYHNARWGVSSNYKGMPIDCPQRDERQPWTGDHNMGSWGENFMFDNANLYAKWTNDMREAQREDGCIPDVCPAFWNYYTPDMTWSSTFPVVCDMIYEQTANAEPIAENYDAIRKWLHFIKDNYTDAQGLVTADKYGDWCMPPEDPKLIHSQDPDRKTEGRLIASAYYYKMTQLMAKFARILDKEAEAEIWAEEGEKIKTAFNQHFLTAKRGTSPVKEAHILYPDSVFYGNNTMTANILPLAFDIVPDEYRPQVAANLIKTIITDNKGHVSCGVVGINWLMRELSRLGRGDVAEMLASSRSYPSWGYMADHGATTIWELWNGDKASRKMNSANHVMMLGDLITWYYRDLAGFNPAKPGYKEIIFRPDFSIEALDFVKAAYMTPYGEICSNWRKTPSHLDWTISVPCNTTALIYVPNKSKKAIKHKDFKYVRNEGNSTVWKVGSGTYTISADIDTHEDNDLGKITQEEFLYENATFPECHASTIVELPNGDLVAAYFGGTKERNPDCCIWVSRKPKGAREWTKPQIAADGVFSLDDPNAKIAGLSGINEETTPACLGPVGPNFRGDIDNARRKACWNPVLFQIPGEEELLLFYKIGATVGDWTGWLVRSNDGGVTWSEREPLPEGFLGPIKNKPEYIQGRLICPSSRENNGWRAWIEYSDDKGKTWHTSGAVPSELMHTTNDTTKLQPIYSIQPSIIKLSDGRLQILCRTRNAKIATSYSEDNGATWSTMTLLDVPNNQSGTDAVTLADGRHVLIYNNFETLPGTPKGPRTPLSIAVSDDGTHWRHAITLEDSPVGQYSYPSIIQSVDGALHAVYTWRRQRIKHVKIEL